MEKPVAILSPHFRTIDELFSTSDLERLFDLCTVKWASNDPIPQETFESYLETAHFVIGAYPKLGREALSKAKHLKAILEVAGAFPAEVDYKNCFGRGIAVLSCAPAFRRLVAEMTMGFLLSGGRGIIEEHENFRKGTENWLGEDEIFDFTLYQQTIGFLGFGSIAQECARLLSPFDCKLLIHDPWLPPEVAETYKATSCDLDTLYQKSRALIIAASPTSDNFQLVNHHAFSKMEPGTLLVLISRAHLVDFDALTEAVYANKIRAAIDVFPQEPLPSDHPIRTAPHVTLSAHRAAALHQGRHSIGAMVVRDIESMIQGKAPQSMQRATPETIYQRIAAKQAATHSDTV